MTEQLLVGEGREIVRRPAAPWRREVEALKSARSPRLTFMTKEHHAVRDAVVVELARRGRALAPESVAEVTGLAPAHVRAILDELEQHLFFLVRNEEGHVSWGFPVTSEPTPHVLSLSSGEAIYAA